jgi:glycosyltransferase involved in cell wall biosynthesis
MPSTVRDPAVLLYVINDLAVGGAQRVLTSQASMIDPSRFRVEVASLELVPDGDFISEVEAAGIPVHRLRRSGESRARVLPRLARLIRGVDPDLIHTHLAAAGVMSRIAAASRRRSRVVVTLHNLRDWHEKRLEPLRWLDRLTMSRCDRIVAVSEAVRDAVIEILPHVAPRVRVIRNGVDLRRVDGAVHLRPHFRQRLGYDACSFVVGTVARLEACKGLDVLIEAAAQAAPLCPELRILLIGDGPERSRLESLARRGGIGDRVRFEGAHDEIRGFLSAMDLFAAPSRTEGLGLAILESLAAGIPALGSRVGGIPEAIEDGVCGELLPPERAELWCERIVHYARHREELIPMAESARRHAAAFSLADSGRALEHLYGELLEPPVRCLEEAA